MPREAEERKDKRGRRYCFDRGGGRVACGKSADGGGAKPAGKVDPAVVDTVKQADAKAQEAAKQGPAVWRAAGAAGKWIRDQTKRIYDALERRYGRTQAIGIFAAGHVVGLATPIAIVPGSTILGMAPFVAMAETYLQARRAVKRVTGREAQIKRLSQEEMMRLGKALAARLKREWESRPKQ